MKILISMAAKMSLCAVFVLALGAGFAQAAPDTVSPEDLLKLLESKADIVVVDAQPDVIYAMGHVPGSVNLPWLPEIDGPGDLPRDKELILYCACAHDEDSTDLAGQLMQNYGYTRVKVLEGGWLKWVELGYPVESAR